MRYPFAFLLLLVLFRTGSAQDTLVVDAAAYSAPLRGALLVTGTFGELRSNHYHAGLDFRGKTGTPVYAVREGFVSRIVASGGGYGQAIYVDHPDGYRSVYGHLETLAPLLKDTLRAAQFATESFRQDLRFDSLAFPVAAGQRIGGVGNRGHSFGPHLHFEMREIVGDVPVNPLQFGFRIPDRRSPQIRKIRVYELGPDGQELAATTHNFGGRDTLFVRSPRVGLAVKAFDRQDALPNWNGIYSATLFVDSLRHSSIIHQRIPFEDTRYLNAATDYVEWRDNKSWFHRLCALPWYQNGARPRAGQQLVPHLVGVPGHGKEALPSGPPLQLQPNRPTTARIEIADYAGNVEAEERILVYRPGGERTVSRPHQYYLPVGEESLIERAGVRLYFPADALYQDLYLQMATLPDASAGRLSPTYQLHHPGVPVHGKVGLRIRPEAVADSLRAHVYIGQCGDDGAYRSQGGRWTDDDWLETDISAFGDYAVLLDTVAPEVRINYFPTTMRRSAGFSVLITDDVGGGKLDFRGTIDGRWALLEYDQKTDKLSHRFASGTLRPGRHTFELTVTDGRGNQTVWHRRFTR